MGEKPNQHLHGMPFFLQWIGAFVFFCLFSPFILLVGIVVWLDVKSNPIFTQERIGMREKPFRIYKWKTMRPVEGPWDPAKDVERITRWGKFLRNYGVDEWLQVLNILKGEMAWVGPRPLPVEYLPLFKEKDRIRFIARPGISGWAQINGRNTLTWEEKFRLDEWYVLNRSTFLDIQIIIKTLGVVFQKETVQKSENMTMDRYTG